jgi:hypothetical protein
MKELKRTQFMTGIKGRRFRAIVKISLPFPYLSTTLINIFNWFSIP